ncbi:MAG: PAS domain S-box protein [Melioribacter sp.]|uniref:PAS domain S-box protein n=1 Tax=Rosettibacter primus TaxID=3111523 RepID=UPI00247EDE1D|nr:PAS domain S-box protein [Melioribacter sp.]
MAFGTDVDYTFNLLFKNHPLPMWIYDYKSLQLLEVNKAAIKKYGYSRKEFLNIKMKDLEPKEDIPSLLDIKKKKIKSKQYGICRHQLKNGNIIFVDITSHKVRYKGKDAVLVISRDINREVLIDQKIEKLNKLYSFLSDVNQTIVRVKEQKKLFYEICKLSHEKANLLCWIGLFENDNIKITACKGFTKSFINKQSNLLNDNSYKKIINQIHKSKKCIILNGLNDRTIDWQIYKRYNINSIAFFPLIISKKVEGILTLYSPLINYFDLDEVKLFTEMAMDISFALDFLRKESEKRKAEELFHLNAELYMNLFETSPVGIVLEDVNGNIIDVNKKFCQIMGYTRDELLKMNVREFQTENKIDHVEENIKRLLAGEILDMEITSIKKGGQPIWVHLVERKVKLPDGRTAILSIAEDITERKKALELLTESEERFRSLYENSTIGLYRTTPEGKILLANKTLINMLGYSSFDELCKRNLNHEGFEPGYERKVFIEKIEKDGIVKGLESAWKRKDGSTIYVRESARAVKDANGKALYYDGTVEDITELKKIHDELVEAKEKAESANKLKDAFIANISHEIRTPLNGILGMVSLIKESFEKYIDEEEEQYFVSIDNSSRRIIRTVDMILNYSRLQTGEFPVEMKRINITSIINNLVLEFKSAASIRNIDFTFENNCGEVFLYLDEYSFTQTISNLIDNAIKYTKKGYVKVILDKNDNDEIIISVKDTGIGISKEYIKHVFEPYIQEEMGYGRAYDGVGLGLALVKKFVELNKAKINLETKKGFGTNFMINYGKALGK